MITREEKALQQRSRAEGIREFAGRAICMSGFAGDDAVRALLNQDEIDPRLTQRFSAEFLDHTKRVLEEAAEPGEGGVFAALWKLSIVTRCGLTVYLKRIPIRQEVIEICNCLELDPYRIGGCKLEIPEDPKDAWQIGVLTDTNQKIIINGDDVRYLDRPQA